MFLPLGWPLTLDITDLGVSNTFNTKMAVVLQAPATGNISKIHLKTTLLSTGTTIDMRIESLVDIDPSGILWGANTLGSVAVSAPNTWYSATLTNPAAVNAGDYLAIVAAPSGTYTYSYLGAFWHSTFLRIPSSPYARQFTFGAWGGYQSVPAFVLEYDDGTVYFVPNILTGDITSNSISSSSTPDELGNKFSLGFSCTLVGACLAVFDTNITGDSLVLYDDSNNVLASSVLVENPTYTSNIFPVAFVFAPVSLSASTNYRLVYKGGNAARYVQSITAPSAALKQGFPLSSDFQLTRRTDNGAWTDDADSQSFLWPLVDYGSLSGAPSSGGGTRMYLG